jgi:hypothetical protein
MALEKVWEMARRKAPWRVGSRAETKAAMTWWEPGVIRDSF